MLLRAVPGDTTAVREASLTIERNAKMQAQLIDDVLDVSRIISGKLRLDVRPSEMSTIIRDAVASVQTAADAKNIQIKVSVVPGASTVVCYAARIQQVVWNLLSNAIKFCIKGCDITVHVERVGSMVRVNVADRGEGISPEFLPHVFERFPPGRRHVHSQARRAGVRPFDRQAPHRTARRHGRCPELRPRPRRDIHHQSPAPRRL